MDISKQDVLDLIYNSDALTLGLVEVLGRSGIDFSMEDSFKRNHVEYLLAIEDAIRLGACVRIYRPELVSKKFKEYQVDSDGLATKVTLHPAGFNIKRDYCQWYNFWEYVVAGEKYLVKNKTKIPLGPGSSAYVMAHEGDIVSDSVAVKNTITYCVYKNRLFYETGPFHNVPMNEHPFFKYK